MITAIDRYAGLDNRGQPIIGDLSERSTAKIGDSVHRVALIAIRYLSCIAEAYTHPDLARELPMRRQMLVCRLCDSIEHIAQFTLEWGEEAAASQASHIMQCVELMRRLDAEGQLDVPFLNRPTQLQLAALWDACGSLGGRLDAIGRPLVHPT